MVPGTTNTETGSANFRILRRILALATTNNIQNYLFSTRFYLFMNMGVFQYEVKFNPRVDNKEERYRLLNQQRDLFDGGVKVC